MLTYAFDRIRAHDMERTLRDVVLSQVNDQLRERCDSDPAWFMTGPLVGRPINGVFVATEPDQNEPRAKYEAQPYELFGYDEQFIGSGPATPQLPRDFRLLLRDAKAPLDGPAFHGRGPRHPDRRQHRLARQQVQLPAGPHGAAATALARPHRRLRLVVCHHRRHGSRGREPTVFRIRRMAADARESVDSGFTSIAPEKLKDELSSLTFVYNDAMTELALRKTRIDDQDVALKRLVQATDAEALKPLASLETAIGAALRTHPNDAGLREAFLQAHDLRGQLENLTAATGSSCPPVRSRRLGSISSRSRAVRLTEARASPTAAASICSAACRRRRSSSTAMSRCSSVRSRT